MANEEFRPNADLSRSNLVNRDLRNLNLSGADLSRANLKGADLRHTNLSQADLANANLEGADLRGSNLSRAVLIKANLKGAILRSANLDCADFTNAILANTDLVGSDCCNADFTEANTIFADFRNIRYNSKTVFPTMFFDLPASAIQLTDEVRDEFIDAQDVVTDTSRTIVSVVSPKQTANQAVKDSESTRTLSVMYMPNGKENPITRQITIPVHGSFRFQLVYKGSDIHREQTFRKTIGSLNGLEKEVLIDVYRLLVESNFTSCNGARGEDGLWEASRSGYGHQGALPGAATTSGTDNGPGCLAYNLLRYKDSGAPGYPILGSIVAALIDDGIWKAIQMREIPA